MRPAQAGAWWLSGTRTTLSGLLGAACDCCRLEAHTDWAPGAIDFAAPGSCVRFSARQGRAGRGVPGVSQSNSPCSGANKRVVVSNAIPM